MLLRRGYREGGGWRSEENLGGEAKQTTPSLLRREGRVPLLLRGGGSGFG